MESLGARGRTTENEKLSEYSAIRGHRRYSHDERSSDRGSDIFWTVS